MSDVGNVPHLSYYSKHFIVKAGTSEVIEWLKLFLLPLLEAQFYEVSARTSYTYNGGLTCYKQEWDDRSEKRDLILSLLYQQLDDTTSRIAFTVRTDHTELFNLVTNTVQTTWIIAPESPVVPYGFEGHEVMAANTFINSTALPLERFDHKELRRVIDAFMSEDDLRDVCFELDTDFESISGVNKSAKVRELIIYCVRNDKYKRLVEEIKRVRPHAFKSA